MLGLLRPRGHGDRIHTPETGPTSHSRHPDVPRLAVRREWRQGWPRYRDWVERRAAARATKDLLHDGDRRSRRGSVLPATDPLDNGAHSVSDRDTVDLAT